MRNFRRYTPSPALVVATAALVMACGGTAIAASGGPGTTDPHQGPPTPKPQYVYKESPTIKVPDSQFDVAIVKCPVGMYPISGGFVTPNSDDMVVKHSRPTNLAGSQKGTQAWTVLMKNPDSADNAQSEFRGYAICAPATYVQGP